MFLLIINNPLITSETISSQSSSKRNGPIDQIFTGDRNYVGGDDDDENNIAQNEFSRNKRFLSARQVSFRFIYLFFYLQNVCQSARDNDFYPLVMCPLN